MLVHLIVHRFPPQSLGGTERYALALAQNLVSRGHRVVVHSYAPGGSAEVLAKEETWQGITTLWVSFDLDQTSNPVRDEYDSHRVESFFAERWRAERPDLVHILHCGFFSASPLRAAAEQSIPALVTLTDMWALCPNGLLLRADMRLCSGPEDAGQCVRCVAAMGPRGRRYRRLSQALPVQALSALAAAGERPILRDVPLLPLLTALRQRPAVIRDLLLSSGALISPGDFARQVLEQNGYPQGGVCVLPHGVESPERLRRQEEPGQGPKLRFGYIGPLAPHKGAHLPIEALRRLGNTNALSLTYWGALPEGRRANPYAQKILHDIEASPSAEHLGAYETQKVAQVLAQLDVLLVPSLCYENTPMVIYEALASGTPVIATDEGGMRELVTEYSGGWLFPRGDAEALASLMGRLATKPSLVTEKSKGILPVPSLEDHVASLMGIYDQILAGGR